MTGAVGSVRNELMDKWFSDTDFTHGDTFVALHTGDPADGTNEVTGGSYARQQVEEAGWNAASDGLVDNVNDIDFNDMPAVTVQAVAIWDAATGGNLEWEGPLTSDKTTEAGDTLRFPVGDLNFQITGPA